MTPAGNAGAIATASVERGKGRMENQHREITGYRDLDEREIALMNLIKEKAEEVGALVADLKAKRRVGGGTLAPLAINLDERWVAIGETHLQQGFMALVRAVAQPETF